MFEEYDGFWLQLLLADDVFTSYFHANITFQLFLVKCAVLVTDTLAKCAWTTTEISSSSHGSKGNYRILQYKQLWAYWDVICLINSGTTSVWEHLLSIYFVSHIYSSVPFVFAVSCT